MRAASKFIWNVAFALAVSGQPHAQTPSSIAVEHPWARATPAGAKTGAIYMSLINSGESADQLIGGTTPIASRVQFHKVSEEDGISRMRELRMVEIAPGAKLTFKPGGMHIMLVGLKQPLREGQTFPLTLDLGNAGKVDVIVSVAKVGAMDHADMGPMMHGADGAMRK